jgi:hypothetical protein
MQELLQELLCVETVPASFQVEGGETFEGGDVALIQTTLGAALKLLLIGGLMSGGGRVSEGVR